MNKIDLGAVSAYALAVEHGYEGTEAEWVEAQEAARVAAEAAASDAQASKESAAASAADAQSSAEKAATSASAAQASQEMAETHEINAGMYSKVAGDASASAQLVKALIDETAQNVEQNASIAEESAAAAQAVLDSIPEDYTALTETVDTLTASKAEKAEVAADINTADLWEKGGISVSSGNFKSANIIRTIGYVPDNVKLIYAEKDYYLNVLVYDADGNCLGQWDGAKIGTDSYAARYIMPDGLAGYKLRLMLRRFDVDTMDVSEYVNVHFLNANRAEVFHPTPTLTFIDDDGRLNALENWESISDEIGVKITSALVTGVMGDVDAEKATWEDVARLQNKGFEFISHTHNHVNVTEITEEKAEEQFALTTAALREHGCESRYLVYPYNSINTDRIPLVRKYFRAGIGLGAGTDNVLPLYTYWIRRYSINDSELTVDKEYNGETVQVAEFLPLETLKGYIDTAMVNGSWVIIMTHLRNDDKYYCDDNARAMLIDLCKYAAEKGMKIQTFGEAFERYKNVLESGTVYSTEHYIVDCNGVVNYRGVDAEA